MRPLLIAALTLPLAAPASAQYTGPNSQAAPMPGADRCGGNRIAGHIGPKAGAHTLAEQPPAARLYALYRMVDGCPEPIVLQEGIGANPERRLPITAEHPRLRRLR